MRNYLDLAVTGNFEREFKQSRFRVLVVADSGRRLDAIRQAVLPLTDKIFWFATIESIRRDGVAMGRAGNQILLVYRPNKGIRSAIAHRTVCAQRRERHP